MRSPWQLIKSFTSRRQTAEAGEPADRLVATAGPVVDEIKQDLSLPTEPAQTPDSVAQSADGEKTNGTSDSANAESELPLPVEQTEPAPSEQTQDQPSSTTPTVGAEEKDTVASRLTTMPSKRGAKPARGNTSRSEPAVKTALDAASELNLEIKDLRSQLSAKLLEQNKQLRRLLERYSSN